MLDLRDFAYWRLACYAYVRRNTLLIWFNHGRAVKNYGDNIDLCELDIFNVGRPHILFSLPAPSYCVTIKRVTAWSIFKFKLAVVHIFQNTVYGPC